VTCHFPTGIREQVVTKAVEHGAPTEKLIGIRSAGSEPAGGFSKWCHVVAAASSTAAAWSAVTPAFSAIAPVLQFLQITGYKRTQDCQQCGPSSLWKR